jgi:hypothetical protein
VSVPVLYVPAPQFTQAVPLLFSPEPHAVRQPSESPMPTFGFVHVHGQNLRNPLLVAPHVLVDFVILPEDSLKKSHL